MNQKNRIWPSAVASKGTSTIAAMAGKPSQSLIRLVAGLAVLFLLAACAGTPVVQKSALELRSQARWDALIAEDYATAWALYSPGYRSGNSAVDLEIGWRSRRVETVAATYDSHECTATLCTVSISLTYRVSKPITGVDEWQNTRIFKEKWISADGNWWYLPD